MGWETIAIAGFRGLQAVNQMKQGEASADAAVQQGEEEATNAANNTVRAAGTLRNSFLSNGLSIQGGPLAAITQTITTGNTNIGRIAQNANNTASNDINSARTAALTTLASTAAMAAGGPSSTFFGSPASFDSLGQTVGNTFNQVGSWFGGSRSIGPYQPFGM